LTEDALIQRMLAGDVEARNDLLTRLWPYILTVVVRVVGSKRSDDYTGFAAEVAIKRLPTYRPGNNIRAWLGWIVGHELKREMWRCGSVIQVKRLDNEDARRAHATTSLSTVVHEDRQTLEVGDRIAAGDESPHTTAERREMRALTLRCLNGMQPVDLDVLRAASGQTTYRAAARRHGYTEGGMLCRRQGAVGEFKAKARKAGVA
jgi:DNA-directed RNA polymerase specialized sigma24 family protein